MRNFSLTPSFNMHQSSSNLDLGLIPPRLLIQDPCLEKSETTANVYLLKQNKEKWLHCSFALNIHFGRAKDVKLTTVHLRTA